MLGFVTLMLISLTLGLLAGLLMHRADFCMAGAFRDLFLFRATRLLAALLVLITVSAGLFELFHRAGMFARFPFPLYAPPSLGNLLGGLIFGVGMVLAGGCVVGVLFRGGAGSRLALWAIAGLLLGSAFYAEIYPFWDPLTKLGSFAGSAITLSQWSGISPGFFVLGLTLATLSLIWRFPGAFRPEPGWRTVSGYCPPVFAALALALIGVLSALFLGMPLGVTTSYAKLAAGIERWLVPAHLATLEFFRTQSFNHLSLPLAAQPLQGGPGPGFDGIAIIQYPLIVGIILGAAYSAWRLDGWRWSSPAPLRQRLAALLGGALMGLASRMTPGCNIWHLWGGLPIFALQSILFALGLLPGAWIGGRLLLRRVLPMTTRGGV